MGTITLSKKKDQAAMKLALIKLLSDSDNVLTQVSLENEIIRVEGSEGWGWVEHKYTGNRSVTFKLTRKKE